MSFTRRRLLAEGARLALAAPLLGVAFGCNGGGACADPDELTTSERSLRASFHFTERSPHGAAMECAGCVFYRATQDGACGRCEILQGPANPRGHCDSWAARAGASGMGG